MTVPSYLNILLAPVLRCGYLRHDTTYQQEFGDLYTKKGTLGSLGLSLYNTLRFDLRDYPTLGDFQKIDSHALSDLHPSMNKAKAQHPQRLVHFMGGNFSDQDNPDFLAFQENKRLTLFAGCPKELLKKTAANTPNQG